MDHTPIWLAQIIYHPNDGEAVAVGAVAFPDQDALDEWLNALPPLPNSDYLCQGESPTWVDPLTGAKGLRYKPVFVAYDRVRKHIDRPAALVAADRDRIENRDRLMRYLFEKKWFYAGVTLVGIGVISMVGGSIKDAELFEKVIKAIQWLISRLP